MPTQQVDSSVGHQPAVVRPLAFGLVGFFLPGLAGLERELRIQAEGLLMQAEMLDWERTGYLGARAGADYHRMRMERLIAERSPETVVEAAFKALRLKSL